MKGPSGATPAATLAVAGLFAEHEATTVIGNGADEDLLAG
jgi:hypothetical protein